jgi:hypothetical protein
MIKKITVYCDGDVWRQRVYYGNGSVIQGPYAWPMPETAQWSDMENAVAIVAYDHGLEVSSSQIEVDLEDLCATFDVDQNVVQSNSWLSHDQKVLRFCQELASVFWNETRFEEPEDRWKTAHANLSRELQSYVKAQNPLRGQPGLYCDLLTAALEQVDWDAMASALLDAVTD